MYNKFPSYYYQKELIKLPTFHNKLEYLHFNQFIKNLDRYLIKNRIFVNRKNYSVTGNKLYIEYDLLMSWSKILEIKSLLIKAPLTNSLKFNESATVSNSFETILNYYYNSKISNISSIAVRFRYLNFDLNDKDMRISSRILFRYRKSLFARKNILYTDFIRMFSLFMKNKINPDLFLFFIGQMFSRLAKRKHNYFFIFLKDLTKFLISQKSSLYEGFKIIIKGKVMGKPRASTQVIKIGNVSVQTFDRKFSRSQTTVFTIYGTFSITLYISYKENMILY